MKEKALQGTLLRLSPVGSKRREDLSPIEIKKSD
jgi:hypothetical protein